MIVEIRGKRYDSVKEAARKLRVKPVTIYSAMNRGTLDTVGLRKYGPRVMKGGRPGQPITIAGHTWPSLSQCSTDLGKPRQYAHKALKCGGPRAKKALVELAVKTLMERA